MTGRPLAFCDQGHTLAKLTVEDGEAQIRYWVGVPGLALRNGELEDGHFNYAPHLAAEPLATVQAGSREIMCKHRHGLHGGVGSFDLADLLPVIQGKRGPITIDL
jgi:hypothetical protein